MIPTYPMYRETDKPLKIKEDIRDLLLGWAELPKCPECKSTMTIEQLEMGWGDVVAICEDCEIIYNEIIFSPG